MSRIKHYNLEEVVTMWAQTRQNGDSDDRRWDVGGAGPEGLAKDGHEAGTGSYTLEEAYTGCYWAIGTCGASNPGLVILSRFLNRVITSI